MSAIIGFVRDNLAYCETSFVAGVDVGRIYAALERGHETGEPEIVVLIDDDLLPQLMLFSRQFGYPAVHASSAHQDGRQASGGSSFVTFARQRTESEPASQAVHFWTYASDPSAGFAIGDSVTMPDGMTLGRVVQALPDLFLVELAD